jgi:hypothetical protein
MTISSGLMSVPVAIMSTVTAIRGLYEIRNDWIRSSGLTGVLYVIFWQNSFPFANSSRTTCTMSSAWLSSLA